MQGRPAPTLGGAVGPEGPRLPSHKGCMLMPLDTLLRLFGWI